MNSRNLLTIDIGNSNSSCVLESNKGLQNFSLSNFQKIKNEFHLKNDNTDIYISNVSKEKTSIDLPYKDLRDFYKEGKFLNMKVNYNETLGIDRITAAYYAHSIYKDACIIDSGTFTTVDFVSKDGFIGGHILPGLELLKRAYLNGEKLKDYSPVLTSYEEPATNTLDSISSGILVSYLEPIKSLIKINPKPTIILTGGNANILKQFIVNSLVLPNLIHDSMRLIHKELQ